MSQFERLCVMLSILARIILLRAFSSLLSFFSLASSKAFSIDAEKAIQLGSVDRFLLSALSAATAITAQSSNRIRNRHLNQVLCF
jgi:hypothetical protein